jgi:hypothetical protein
MPIARYFKRVIPRSLKALWWTYSAKRDLRELESSQTAEEAFSAVYRRGHWGKSSNPAEKFYSGSGSHDVAAVRNFIATQQEQLNAVDLGCGDFSVGSQLQSLFKNYTACDVVPDLIKHNSEKFKSLGVVFRQLDIIKDPLPPGDIVFIRQVLQHLSNEDIQNIVSKVSKIYRYLVLTEHLPANNNFLPNKDHRTGRDVRIANNSGIVLTEPPFNFRAKREFVLCEVPENSGADKGIIRSTFYEL